MNARSFSLHFVDQKTHSNEGKEEMHLVENHKTF